MITYDPAKHIDITGVDLRELAKQAYALSEPKGMGVMHFQPGPISANLLDDVMAAQQANNNVALRLDYVSGRACKLTVYNNDGCLFMARSWYDHTDDQLRLLLAACNVEAKDVGGEHRYCCECAECKTKEKAR